MAYAPNGSEEHLGHSNRSALNLHLQAYESWLTDIERALKITGFDSLKIKLMPRKIDCLVLGQLYLHERYASFSFDKLHLEVNKLLKKVYKKNSEFPDNVTKMLERTKSLVKKSTKKEESAKRKKCISSNSNSKTRTSYDRIFKSSKRRDSMCQYCCGTNS